MRLNHAFATRANLIITLAGSVLAGCHDPSEPAPIRSLRTGALQAEAGNVVTIDHAVPHISTVVANAGDQVNLFVRERVRSDITDRPREAVLMIHGRSVPVLAVGELR